MSNVETRFAYLMITSPLPNVFIGGVMVVDGRGLPVEFRYSEPIQPTKIQQVLYGTVLARYIKTEVILDTLMKSLETQPDLVIVNDESVLDHGIEAQAAPLIRLSETKSGPLKSTGATEKISANEYLIQLTPESSPVRVQLEGTPAGSDVGGARSLGNTSQDDSFSNSEIYTLLTGVGGVTDILEPLKRVEKALATLCQEAGLKPVAT